MTATQYPTEKIAREMIEGLQIQLDQLILPVNDNNRAAWEQAASVAKEIAYAAQIVADAINNRPNIQDRPYAGQVSATVVPAPALPPEVRAVSTVMDLALNMVRPA